MAPKTTTRKKRQPTPEHLEAMAAGREAGRAVKDYLLHLESRKRGVVVNR